MPVVGIVAFTALRPSVFDNTEVDRPDAIEAPLVTEEVASDRLATPLVGGQTLPLLSDAVRPTAPSQWGQPGSPVPFGQWWSGLATGPGIPALWAKPLLLRMGPDGRADLSAPLLSFGTDGFRDAHVTPALFFEFGEDATVQVIDQGPLHVRFSVESEVATVTVTLVQGSPFLEFEGDGELLMTVPALSELDGGDSGARFQQFDTAAGPWLIASSDAPVVEVEGDRVALELVPGQRHVIGPVPADADEQYRQAAIAVADARLVDTTETLAVSDEGTVLQTLAVQREAGGDGVGAWALLPHHIDFFSSSADPIAVLQSVHGDAPIHLGSTLELDYPAVPIVWDAVAPTSGGSAVPFDAESLIDNTDRPEEVGSYFGAKTAATNAMVHDILRAAGTEEAAVPFLEAAAELVAELVEPGSVPALAWEPQWGSVVVTPPEFGAADQLNDHQLQHGYWVAAAASVVVADPTQRPLLQDGIDLLIADYAGADVVPGFDGVVADEGTWSAFAGHSWASGLGGFGAGNNLESISESSHAWWAAAKWFIATDRPDMAAPFVARLTIESWLTGYEWLPTLERAAADQAQRPWSGVVWSSKANAGTWFSASDETALGIRLIPLGPQSFSRYPDADSLAAANGRWDWCESQTTGCLGEWSNLLDSDAAVAGRSQLDAESLPEPSTSAMVQQWWRMHWETSALGDDWRCPPGTIVRYLADGSPIGLVTNPSSRPVEVVCTHASLGTIEVTAAPRSATAVSTAD